VLVRVMIGRRLPRGLSPPDLGSKAAGQSRADFRGRRRGRGKRVEMAERRRKLHQKRKKRDPGKAFDVRPNPRHSPTHPALKGLKIKAFSTLPQVSRTWLSGVKGGPSKRRRNSDTCGISATPQVASRREPPAPNQSRDRPDCRSQQRASYRSCEQISGSSAAAMTAESPYEANKI